MTIKNPSRQVISDTVEAVEAYRYGGAKLLILTMQAIKEARGMVNWEMVVFSGHVREAIKDVTGAYPQHKVQKSY